MTHAFSDHEKLLGHIHDDVRFIGTKYNEAAVPSTDNNNNLVSIILDQSTLRENSEQTVKQDLLDVNTIVHNIKEEIKNLAVAKTELETKITTLDELYRNILQLVKLVS